MFKKENLRKNFFRVKQFAGQNLGRVEKTEVLTDDLQLSEKRVEVVKHAASTTIKKLGTSLLGAGTTDIEKRLKKTPEAGVGHSMIESAGVLGQDSIMGQMYQMCGECENSLAQKHLQYELDVEKNVLKPLEDILENEIPQISKLKRALNKLTLDMDSAKGRWNAAVRQTQVPGTNMSTASAKADTVKEELEEATSRMEQAKDAYTTGMLKFISREADQSHILVSLLEAQAAYHREALAEIERVIPRMSESLSCNPAKPVYGVSLEEHLRVTNRDIAQVLEACIVYLLDYGLEEEGLFRIAGMASKVKKLKASFDAGIDLDYTGDLDPHTVAGALKQYLRELPEPLLTFNLFNEFMKAASMPADQRLQALWCVVDQLPKPNYDNFKYLVKFLSEITKKSDVNKMNPGNISIVIGPNLIWSEGDTGPNMLNTGILSLITELIIQHADWFFPGALDFHATQRGTAAEHRMREHPQLPQKPGHKEVKVIQPQTDAARQAVPGPSVATNTNVVVQRKKIGALPSQESSTDISTSSSESASLSDLSPQMKDYENADTLERGDNSESYHTAKEINFGNPTENPSPKESPKLGKFQLASDTPTQTEGLGIRRSSSNQSMSSHGTPQSSPANQETASPVAPPSTPPTAARSGSSSPAGSHANLTGPPSSESEDQPAPQQPVMRRPTRKPAPPPPPQVDRPYSVAVSASIKVDDLLNSAQPSSQYGTWPRQTAPPQDVEVCAVPMATSDKRKTMPPGRPCPPERVSSIPKTQDHVQSHTLERPKIPPPVVPPKHTRSASTGATMSIPSTLFEGQENAPGTESPRPNSRASGEKAASSSNHTQLTPDRHSHSSSLSKQNIARMSRPMPPPPPPPADSSIVEETHL